MGMGMFVSFRLLSKVAVATSMETIWCYDSRFHSNWLCNGISTELSKIELSHLRILDTELIRVPCSDFLRKYSVSLDLLHQFLCILCVITPKIRTRARLLVEFWSRSSLIEMKPF